MTCPKCGSHDVDSQPLFPRENMVDQECECLECGHEWDVIVTTKVMPKAEILADEFSLILISWLTTHEMRMVRQLNEDETSPDVCHSHDYCDANMAMDQAFTRLTGREMDTGSDADAAVINKAWAIAKKNRFTPIARSQK